MPAPTAEKEHVVRELQLSWKRTWESLGATPPPGLYERLSAAYQEPQRSYHTIQHLYECLYIFDGVRKLAVHPGEVELAIWFHDANYDPKGQENEALSARWAMTELARYENINQPRIADLIMATCHNGIPETPDAQLLVDIDLAIFSSFPGRFHEYETQIRQEYAWVPFDVYREERRKVLQSFLNRPSIYSTDHYKTCFEEPARINLTRAIEALSAY